MSAVQYVRFGPFQMELTSHRVWREVAPVPLQRKVAGVLALLIQHAGDVVAKEAFFDALWAPGTGSKAALKTHISALRKVLGDQADVPTYIQTYHGYGYAFIMPVHREAPAAPAPSHPARARVRGAAAPLSPAPSAIAGRPMVGREAVLASLHGWLKHALQGRRQVVLVTGEAGIGKTTVVEAFARQARAASAMHVAHGQCLDYLGPGEPYRPLLDALGRLCAPPECADLVALLARYAPTWLVQMPWLLPAADLERLHHLTLGARPHRMLRELTQALEALTAQQPLVLILEDLQHSDGATLDALSELARRQEPARLLLLGTYRAEEVQGTRHPFGGLVQDLLRRGHCQTLALPGLTPTAVEAYLQECVPGTPLPVGLAQRIYQRTEGHPLFLVTMVDALLAQGGWPTTRYSEDLVLGVPDTLQELIAQRFARCTPQERRVLAVASVAGVEFTAAMVAAGLDLAVEAVEACCTRLTRQGRWLRADGPQAWPDGTVSEAYRFTHALYQDVLYQRGTTAWRQRLHRHIGARLEAAYGAQARDLATALAVHFEQGGAYARAIPHLGAAAEQALRRGAAREATSLLQRGLTCLNTLPETRARAHQELDLVLALTAAVMVTQGYGAPEVEHLYTRAQQLCAHLGDRVLPQRFQVLFGLRGVYMARADLPRALQMARRSLTLAERVPDPRLLQCARYTVGATVFHLGDLATAHTVLAQAALPAPSPHPPMFIYGHDLRVTCLAYTAWTLWCRGYPDQAQAQSAAALAWAQELAHPFSLAYALVQAAMVQQWRRALAVTQQQATAVMALAAEQGFALWLAVGTMIRGWTVVMYQQEPQGLTQIREGLEALRATGTRLMQPYLLALLAEAYGAMQQPAAGLAVLAEACTGSVETGEQWYDAELYRLRGTLLAQTGAAPQETEAAYHQALATARRQQAKAWELRAAMRLARLWQQQGKQAEARALLAPVYDWFTEGFDTADLQEAKALREEITG